MRKRVLVICCLGLLLIAGCADKDKGKKRKTPISYTTKTILSYQPGIQATVQGASYDFRESKAKVTLINFWATWCPPCNAEIPHLIKLENNFKGYGLEVIGISVDNDARAVQRFVKRLDITYPIIMNTPEIREIFGAIPEIPKTYILNSKLEVVEQLMGYQSYNFLETVVKKHLNIR
jgi:thiol-disulfide isomerase/thioredoxin